jgi:hypothetical protein
MASLFKEVSKNVDPELPNIISMPNMNALNIRLQENYQSGFLTWTNIEWLRKLTKLPIICKGILSPIDAELAIKYGANGIIVRFAFASIQLIEYILFYDLLLVIMVVDKLIQHHQLLNV